MSAVNATANLNGIMTASLEMGASRLAAPLPTGRLVDLWHGAVEAVVGEAGAGSVSVVSANALSGFSLKLGLFDGADGEAGKAKFVVETLVHNDVLIIQLSTEGSGDAAKNARYQALAADGKPLPGWLKHAAC